MTVPVIRRSAASLWQRQPNTSLTSALGSDDATRLPSIALPNPTGSPFVTGETAGIVRSTAPTSACRAVAAGGNSSIEIEAKPVSVLRIARSGRHRAEA